MEEIANSIVNLYENIYTRLAANGEHRGAGEGRGVRALQRRVVFDNEDGLSMEDLRVLGLFRRVAIWGFIVGGIAFAFGFFGPLIWAPDANQGPLLGIFYTGPLGTLAGLAIGFVRELLGWKATPLELLESRGLGRTQLARGAAGVGGVVILMHGLRGLPAGAGRAAAASVVVGFALLWYAAVGRIPAWFHR